MESDQVKLTLTVSVVYEPGRTDIRELQQQLVRAADYLASKGLLTGETEASVLTWESAVT